MTPDQERWAEALAIERGYGSDAPRYIAERIGALALAGDTAGVERFKLLATLLDKLRQPGQHRGHETADRNRN